MLCDGKEGQRVLCMQGNSAEQWLQCRESHESKYVSCNLYCALRCDNKGLQKKFVALEGNKD